MSPPRRRSARLRGGTPAKNKAAPELSSVAEHQDPPAQQPLSINNVLSSPAPAPSTPVSSAVKPPHDEMHPSKAHVSMASPSSALRLGFADIKSTEKNASLQPKGQDMTPSKVSAVPSSPFTFRIAQQSAEIQLSEGAQQIMNELREKAAQIKEQLVAQREAEGGTSIGDRKIAQPKRKSGRFSAAHMAEFKKMDSIEGHASAWRAQNGRFTPVKSSLKRSPSKANLDGTPTSAKSSLKRSPSKANLDDSSSTSVPRKNLKRTSSVAKLDSHQDSPSPKKNVFSSSIARPKPAIPESPVPTAKRVKKLQTDDASSTRPSSRDGSSIPRPGSSGKGLFSQSHASLSRLMTPTKASLAHLGAQGKSTVSLVESPSRPTPGSLTKPAFSQSVTSSDKAADFKRRIISPGRFQKVKSILRRQKSADEPDRTAIPTPTAFLSQTPGPASIDKVLPPLPLTTPRRKLPKKVTFTPDTARGDGAQNSPSPLKFGSLGILRKRPLEEVEYPALDEMLTETTPGDVVYPDLSAKLNGLTGNNETGTKQNRVPSVPGKFTFRSDHTIEFGETPAKGFGASAGQSSIRHVRGSIMPTVNMPGSFPPPPSPSSHPNKENTAPEPPKMLFGAPHGMANKKRHRASTDEEDARREDEERAAKKRKNEHVPEGEALLAPRLVGSTPIGSAKKLQTSRPLGRTPTGTPSRSPVRTPIRTSHSASPSKKRPILSVSRLNMLARPKSRA